MQEANWTETRKECTSARSIIKEMARERARLHMSDEAEGMDDERGDDG